MMDLANWIKPTIEFGDVVPNYFYNFILKKPVESANITITVLGVYEAFLNGKRIGDYVLAPGFTAYNSRLQYQTYDISELLKKENKIEILVGKGWYRSRISWPAKECPLQREWRGLPPALLAKIELIYKDGTTETILSDKNWKVEESQVRFSEIYDGEIYDAGFTPKEVYEVEDYDGPSHTLIAQEGELIKEQEVVYPSELFVTPSGEIVIDFGQEVTGNVEIELNAKEGEVVDLSFAEVMDKDGNFYTENYRTALAQYRYKCKDGKQQYKPRLTFFGFRYIRVNEFPGGANNAKIENFKAIVIHSELKRTGYIHTSNPLLNKLFENVIWGQKGNFLDVPTDCPQRDERMGWTGDAQVFIKTACLNYDVEKFFLKWLGDMRADQYENGMITKVVPNLFRDFTCSSGWGDAAVICPWELYLAYGNTEILKTQFSCMKKWIGYITSTTNDEYLWTGGRHYGDWLGLDAPEGSYKGSTREPFISTAFYAHSTELVIKIGKILGEDVTEYETLFSKIKAKFQETFPEYLTQTECILAAHFNLAPDCQAAADKLAEIVKACGTKIQTGFIGTPYILHVLSDYGYEELAYSLLLREDFPSWLYPVRMGATTIWEHWDGLNERGEFWSSDMNSYNHYAYGSVADWMYGVAAGIKPVEEAPGYQKVAIKPIADQRLDWFEASVETRYGRISSKWTKEKDRFRYDIETPVEAEITIGDITVNVKAGKYLYYRKFA